MSQSIKYQRWSETRSRHKAHGNGPDPLEPDLPEQSETRSRQNAYGNTVDTSIHGVRTPRRKPGHATRRMETDQIHSSQICQNSRKPGHATRRMETDQIHSSQICQNSRKPGHATRCMETLNDEFESEFRNAPTPNQVMPDGAWKPHAWRMKCSGLKLGFGPWCQLSTWPQRRRGADRPRFEGRRLRLGGGGRRRRLLAGT